jgi:hypothetical protein
LDIDHKKLITNQVKLKNSFCIFLIFFQPKSREVC